MDFIEDPLDISLLDDGIDLSANDYSINEDKKNPFFVSVYGSEIIKTKSNIIYSNHKNVFLLTRRNDLSEDDLMKLNLFYDQNTKLKELNDYNNYMVAISAPINIIKNQHIKKGTNEVTKSDITLFNHRAYELPDNCLVYMMLQTSEKYVDDYLKMLNPSVNIDEFITSKIFTSYFKLSDRIIDKSILSKITESHEFKYWTDPANCNLSCTNVFTDRKFNFTIRDEWKKSVESIEKLLEKTIVDFPKKKSANNDYNQIESNPESIDNIDDIDHVAHFDEDDDNTADISTLNSAQGITNIFNDRAKRYADPSKRDVNTYYKVFDEIDEKIIDKNIQTMISIIGSDTIVEEDKIYLLSTLIASKNHCHHIIKSDLMKIHSDLIKKYLPIIKYTIGYAFTTLYLEESIKKSNIKENDRFVFTLEQANNLPVFPFDSENMKSNPYLTSLLNDNKIPKKNIGSIKFDYTDQQGIVNIDEFKKRLNIFISNFENIDLLKDFDWSHSVITGGCMAAILPKKNPLMNKFTDYQSFIDEYYPNSDIDVACNHDNIFDFIENVINLRNCIINNYNLNEDTFGFKISEKSINVQTVKSLPIYIDYKLLRERCNNGKVPFNFDYIIKNKNTTAVKSYFYQFYYKMKSSNYEKTLRILGDRINDPVYASLLDAVNLSDVTLIITDYGIDNKIENRNPDMNNGFEMVFKIFEDGEIFINCMEVIKFKLSSKYLKNTFEVFRINCRDFFACIGRFHLPCVRSYYNGKTCYLLPSSITAYHTLTNIDFKYFVGSKDPISIMDKYRMRGYSMILNNTEIKQYMIYITQMPLYKKLYNITSENMNDAISKICGSLTYDSTLFEPRKVIPFEYSIPTGKPENIPKYIKINNINENKDANSYFGNLYPKCKNLIELLQTINSNGNVNKFKPWLIDAIIDSING